MEDKPKSNKLGSLLDRLFHTVGSVLLLLVVVVGIGYGSNYLFDLATTHLNGSCLVLDQGADLCVKRDTLPVPSD